MEVKHRPRYIISERTEDLKERISKNGTKKGAGRIAKWDNARWILITLVVICHFLKII